jgi:hypothetical protein
VQHCGGLSKSHRADIRAGVELNPVVSHEPSLELIVGTPSHAKPVQTNSPDKDRITLLKLPPEVLELIIDKIPAEHVPALLHTRIHNNPNFRERMQNIIQKKIHAIRHAIIEAASVTDFIENYYLQLLLPLSHPQTLKTLRSFTMDEDYPHKETLACIQKLISVTMPDKQDITNARIKTNQFIDNLIDDFVNEFNQRHDKLYDNVTSIVHTLLQKIRSDEDIKIAIKWHDLLETRFPQSTESQCEALANLAGEVLVQRMYQPEDLDRLLRKRDGKILTPPGRFNREDRYSSAIKSDIAIGLMNHSSDPAHLEVVRTFRNGSILLPSAAIQRVSEGDRMRLAIAAVARYGISEDVWELRIMCNSSHFSTADQINGATALIQHVEDPDDFNLLVNLLNKDDECIEDIEKDFFLTLLARKYKYKEFNAKIQSVAEHLIVSPEISHKLKTKFAIALLNLKPENRELCSKIRTLRNSSTLSVDLQALLTNALLNIKANQNEIEDIEDIEDIDKAATLYDNENVEIHDRAALTETLFKRRVISTEEFKMNIRSFLNNKNLSLNSRFHYTEKLLSLTPRDKKDVTMIRNLRGNASVRTRSIHCALLLFQIDPHEENVKWLQTLDKKQVPLEFAFLREALYYEQVHQLLMPNQDQEQQQGPEIV